jgi:2-polyprenyl-3-methyl-5-hydroxy-6-metoxy-1,4-benzoquinol methylase
MKIHVCPWWLAYTFDNPIRRFFHKPDQMLAKFVKEGMTVVDIGCGMGYFSIGLAKILKGN